MAGPTQTMPDGWSMGSGRWNVDAQLATGSFNGVAALHIGGTTTATVMYGPWVPLDNTVAGTASYEVTANVGANTVNPFACNFVVYNSLRTSVVSTVQLFTTSVANAQHSAILAAPGGPWGRFEISKTAALGTAIIYNTMCRRLAPNFIWGQQPDQVIANTTWTSLAFGGTSSKKLVEMLDQSAGGVGIVAPTRAGFYMLSMNAYFRSVPQGTNIMCRFWDAVIPGVISGTSRSGHLGVAPGLGGSTTANDMSVTLSQLCSVASTQIGSQLEAQVWQNSGGNLSVIGSTTFAGLATGNAGFPTVFTGVCVK